AVEDMGCGVDVLAPRGTLVRKDHGDAGSNRVGIAVLPADDRSMAHPHAGYVGNGVERTGRSPADPDPQVAGPVRHPADGNRRPKAAVAGTISPAHGPPHAWRFVQGRVPGVTRTAC